MADTIFTRALQQAINGHGSSQALAHLLRVPESTLLRWMSGRAQMPLRAFDRLIELLVEHEQSAGSSPSPTPAPAGALTFNLGDLLARCARCPSTQFVPKSPAAPLQMKSVLLCSSCRLDVTHGALLARLASDAVRRSRDVGMLGKRPGRARRGAGPEESSP